MRGGVKWGKVENLNIDFTHIVAIKKFSHGEKMATKIKSL